MKMSELEQHLLQIKEDLGYIKAKIEKSENKVITIPTIISAIVAGLASWILR